MARNLQISGIGPAASHNGYEVLNLLPRELQVEGDRSTSPKAPSEYWRQIRWPARGSTSTTRISEVELENLLSVTRSADSSLAVESLRKREACLVMMAVRRWLEDAAEPWSACRGVRCMRASLRGAAGIGNPVGDQGSEGHAPSYGSGPPADSGQGRAVRRRSNISGQQRNPTRREHMSATTSGRLSSALRGRGWHDRRRPESATPEKRI